METRYPTLDEAREAGWLTTMEAKRRARTFGCVVTDQHPAAGGTEFGYRLWLARDGERTQLPYETLTLTDEINAVGKRPSFVTAILRSDLDAAIKGGE